MQSENFDKKIRESAEQHSPAYNERAWDNMEQLLDKHLPQKKDNRRILFIIFFFLLLGGGAFWLVNYQQTNKKSQTVSEAGVLPDDQREKTKTVTEKETINPLPATSEKNKNDEAVTTNQISKLPEEKNSIIEQASVAVAVKIDNVSKDQNSKQKPAITRIDKKKQARPEKSELNNAEEKIESETGIALKKNTNDIAEGGDPIKSEQLNAENEVAENKIEEQQDLTQKPDLEKKLPEESLNSETTTNQVTKPKPNKRSSFKNNLFVTVSAGPDMSFVGFLNPGTVKLVYGAGLGYQVSKKLAVRTGFYTTHKIYNANPEEYNPPPNFWNYYPNLKSIDADCKVYEIPVTIDYTIKTTAGNNWFVSAGLSSLLMKKEVYDYYFKPNSSPNYISYTRSYENQNKHYFSVLNLSGGYSRKISPKLSIQAEPYLKIALTGVGYGKVKLNSGGLLLSAKISPFASRK